MPLPLTYLRAHYVPSTPTHLRRSFSCILKSFSWAWDGIITNPQDFDEVAQKLRNKNFLLSWHAFERDVLKVNGDSRFQDFLRVLAIGLEYGQTPSQSLTVVSTPEESLSVFDYQKLCNILAGYRFVELLVLRENIGLRVLKSTALSGLYLPSSTNTRNIPQGFDRLQDWPTILSSFQATVDKNMLTCTEPEIPDGSSRLLILMHLLVRSELKSQYVNIENNLLYAALHIYAFNMGIFPEGVIPNLPGEQKNIQIQFADEVSQQEYADVTATLLKHHKSGPSGGNSGHASLCAPLHLALFISPIYLLLPFRIVKQSFHRRSIIEVSHKLGPHKPPLLLELENLIWDAIFAIAERPLHIKNTIIELVTHIREKEEEYLSCSPTERSWFTLSNELSRMIINQDHSHSETDNAPLDNAVSHAVPPLPPSVTSCVQPSHSGECEMIENPIPIVADADISGTHIFRCSSPLTALTPSTSPSSPASDPREPPVLLLSAEDIDHSASAGCRKPQMIDMGNESSTEASKSSTSSPRRKTAGIDCESDSAGSVSSTNGHRTKLHDVESESESEVNGETSGSRKRKIDDSEGESGPEENEGSQNGGYDKDERMSERDATANGDDYMLDGNAAKKPSFSNISSQRPRRKRARTSLKQQSQTRPKSLSDHQKALPMLRENGNSASNPIDIDEIYSLFEPSVVKEYVEKENISFARDAAPIKTESTFDLHAFNACGERMSFKIKAHYPHFLGRIKQFFDHASTDYVQGMPRRFTDPATSILDAITYETLLTMDADVVQQMFSQKNIVVTGCPRDVNLKFDSHGLRTLTGSMSTQISITDFSTLFASGDDHQPCVPSVLSGVVQDLLDNAEDTDTSKILNALDFPLWDGSRERNGYATDMAAWDVTRGLHIFNPSALYPTGDVRWGLAGLRNTMTFLHIDPDGFHTESMVGVGAKAWGILRERPGLKTSSINFYLDDGFSLNEITDYTQYDFEIIALQPGDRIYMLPNTPHFVFGMENSICYGAHFYSTLTMQQTLSGVIHSFMLDQFLTNTTHLASRQLLRRILVFYLHGLMDKKISTEDSAWAHLPNLDQINGLMSLLSLCVLVILGNVLDFRTYTTPGNQHAQSLTEDEKRLITTNDINGIPTNERLAMCYTRGAALHLFRWVRECCIIYGPEDYVVEDLPSRFLTQIGRAMICYKTRAEAKSLEGAMHCSLGLLTSQINNVMASDDAVHKMWLEGLEQQSESLELENQSKYRIEWRVGWELSGRWSSAATDYKTDGCTVFDLTYFSTQAKRVHAEHSRMASFFGPIDTRHR